MRRSVVVRAKKLGAVMLCVATFMTSFPANGLVYAQENEENVDVTAQVLQEEGEVGDSEVTAENGEMQSETESEMRTEGETQTQSETESETQIEGETQTQSETESEETETEETQEETETETETEIVDLEGVPMAMSLNQDFIRKDLIARLTFDDDETGFEGGGAKAEKKGGPVLADDGKSGKALRLDGSDDWLNVVASDGSSLLQDLEEVTISYYSKLEGKGWPVFAAPYATRQSYPNEHYLGVLEDASSVLVERYDNYGRRPANTSIKMSTASGWKHVVIVVDQSSTTLYVNGEKKSVDVVPEDATTRPDQFQLSTIMGDSSVFQIGKGNWDNGEFFKGLIDEVEVYGKALTEDEIDHLEDRFQLDEKETVQKILAGITIPNADNIRGNITLTTKNEYDAKISWKSSDTGVITDKEMYVSDYDNCPAGVVTRQDRDVKVTLTVTVTYKGVTDSKDIEVTVRKKADEVNLEKYMFVYFPSNSEEQIYFALGEDAFHFKDVNDGNPVLTSDIGDQGVRDPYIFRSAEGDKFYMLATDLKVETTGWEKAQYDGSLSLVIWESEDLVNWSEPRLVDTGMAVHGDIGCVWAPEAIYDTKTGEYVVFWASMTKGHQVVYYAKTRDFVQFTEPVKYIDRGGSTHCIDTTMILAEDGKYYRASADGEITIETSDSILGEWSKVTTLKQLMTNMQGYDTYKSETNVELTGGKVEGPELFKMNEGGTYGLYVDNYGGVGYIPITTTDLADTEGSSYTLYDKKDYSFGSMKKRHGSILGITAKEYEAVKEKWGFGAEENTEEKKDAPVLSYTFDETFTAGTVKDSNGDNTGKLYGGATYQNDSQKGQVLYLDGKSNTYLEFPQGFFDGRNEFTLSMDVKAETVSGNFFVWTIGQNNTKYLFFKTQNESTRLSITTGSWGAEQTLSVTTDPVKDKWVHWDIVVEPGRMTIYQDGILLGEKEVSLSVTDLGKNVIGYLGKSFYSGDAFFEGYFDDVKVYNRVLSEDEIAQNQGIIQAPVKEISGKDITFTKKMDIDDENATIILYPSVHNSKADLSAADLSLLVRDGASVSEGTEFVQDLSKEFRLTISYDYNRDGEVTSKEWTVKSVFCGNPVLGGQYADPDIDIFGDTYYIYPTTDGYSGWSGTQFHVFSSKNLVDWTDHGVILDLATDDVVWSDGSAWAPTIEEKNGKYYFYFCGNDTSTNKKAIGVAVADTPTGPFVAKDEPLITMELCAKEGISMGQAIDPSVFTEDDGTSYLLFGNGNAAIVELADDMTSIVSGTMKNISGLTGFREAVTVTKRQGVYHFTWSCDDTGSENYSVNYGTADSLYGTVTSHYKILEKDSENDMLGTGHHSIVQIPGEDEYYIAYHRFVTPLGQYSSGFGYHREVCLDKLSFDEDNFMERVTPTLEGVSERILLPTIKESMLAKFTFDDTENGFTCNKAVMTPQKNVTLTDKSVKGKALAIENDWFTITDQDGNSLLTGLDELTISYYSKTGNDGGWTFYAAPNSNAQSWPNEHYIGITDNKNGVKVERYNNNGSRPASNEIKQTNTEWKHVIVVLNQDKTTLYIDGSEGVVVNSNYSLQDILKNNSILQIGKANWGNGEFYKGFLDELTLYNRALTAKEVQKLFDADQEEEESAECELIASYSFAEMSGKVENDTVVKDASGNGNDATVKGNGARVVRDALVLPGGANGSDAAYVEIPKDVFMGEETLTISLWLQNNMGKGDYSAMFIGTQADQNSNFPSFYWLLNPCNPSGYFKSVMTNQDITNVNTSAPYSTETAVSTKATDSGWSLYTTVIKPGSITGYYNGNKVSTAKKSVLIEDFGDDIVSYIGKSTYPDKIFSGQVKDVQIYRGAMAEADIRMMYDDKQETYPTSDIQAVKVETQVDEEMTISAGDDLSHDVKITLSDGATVNGYINWNQDITALEAGDYEIEGTIDYFPYPLVEERADPYMYFDEESGQYYFCGSWPAYGSIQKGYDRIALRTADSLSGIANAQDHVIWQAHTDEDELRYHIWAPELHKIGNDWYIFFAGGTRSDGWNIRAFVLKCEGGKDILDAENWEEMGRFTDKDGNSFDSMTLDMTYFENNGHHYVIWADCAHDSDLIIGEIDPEKPYQLISDEITLSEPEYSWERVRIPVNEGPAVFKRDGKIYVTYSASATGDEYCVGLLEIDETEDVLDPDNWKKYTTPVLASGDAEGEYGPGHNSFSIDENGNLVMIYHARDERCHNNQCGYSNVDSLYDPCRNTLMKYVRFTEDGQPVFSSSAQTEIPESMRTVKVQLNVGNLTAEEKAQADLDAIALHDLDQVRGNLPLVTVGEKFKNKITWTSSNEKVISATGEVSRPDKDTRVTLTASIQIETKNENASLLQKVLKWNKSVTTVERTFEANVIAKTGTLNYDAYLFAYFTGEGYSDGEQIYFATSEDGLNWTALNQGKPVITSTMGECGLRDPYIMRSPEGDKFYLIATDLRIYDGNGWTAAQENGSKSIMIWESTDLVNWSEQRMVEVATKGAGCTWAPEAFYDSENGEYVVFWSSKIPGSQNVENNDYTHRVYYATTRDFYTFSEPEVWIELHNPEGKTISVIDATVIKVGDTYYRFTKNEATEAHKAGMPGSGKYIILESSKSLMGDWEEINAPNVNKLTGREGATCFQFNQEDKWCLLIDNHGNGGYHPLTTTDLSSGEFTALASDEYSFPSTMRHGSVLNITAREYEALQQKYNPDYKEYDFVIDGEKANTNPADAFKGIGAVSANNSSRLLMDYKSENEKEYWEIMNTLFNKETGAGLSYVKVELGSDVNSSSGTEPASMRSEDETPDVTRGAGWMFAADAKKINPEVQVDALRWSEPAWVGGDYEKRYTWYIQTLRAVYDEYGLKLDYLSADQNETASVDTEWIKYLAAHLDAEVNYKGYDFSKIKIVASDEISSFDLPQAMMEDEELRNAVDAIGIHYTTKSDENMLILNEEYGKELFYSEGVSPTTPADESAFYDGSGLTGTNGALDVANRIINSYYNGSMVLYEYQPAVAAYYDGAKYFPKQILTANTPWSGYYKTDIGVWTTAHFMQFIDAGWQYVDGACFGDGTENQTITPGSSTNNYVTLTNPQTGDYTIVATNDSAKVRSYRVRVENLEKANATLKMIQSIGPNSGEDYDANWFTCIGTCEPVKNSDGSYTISFKVKPYSILTLTTLTDRGPEEGKTGITKSTKENEVMTLPYEDDFEYTDTFLSERGQAPRYTTDQGGAFEVVTKADGNKVLQQKITRSNKPADWRYRTTPNPYTVLGDDRWANYTVSVDVKLDASSKEAENYAGIGGRHITTNYSDSYANAGYELVIYGDGTWALLDINTAVKSGKIDKFDIHKSYHLALECKEYRITAYIDGKKVAAYTDKEGITTTGKVSLMSGYYQTEFDNLKVEGLEGHAFVATNRMDNFNDQITYKGSISHAINAGYAYYGRTVTTATSSSGAEISHTTKGASGTKNAYYYYNPDGSDWGSNSDNAWFGNVGAYYEITFYGNGIELYGVCNNSNGTGTVYVDGVKSGSLTCYSDNWTTKTIYTVDGLETGTHTIKVMVDKQGGYLSAAGATVLSNENEDTNLSFSFEGSGFQVVGQGSEGTYKIYVDDKLVGTQTASDVKGKQSAITVRNLTYGNHTAKIAVISGNLKVDAIEIMSEITGTPDLMDEDFSVEDAVFDLQTAVNAYTLTEEEKAQYSPSSLAKFEEAYDYAKKVSEGWGEQSVERIESYYNKLIKKYNGLQEKGTPVHYTSFTGTNGETWLDTDGTEIQAHGGQVLPVEQADGSIRYYWYGEDKTDGYRTVDGGVRVYSSTDLYNWKAEGLALRNLTDIYDFEEDYFAQLYQGATDEEKASVLLGINDSTSVIERPKVIYNAENDKYVMWFHADGPTETSTANYAAASAGVAVSDSPTGPFRYIGRYRLNYINGAHDSSKGMARDMNLFVDDDGTAYIIYSSEENQTMFISQLDADYTALAYDADLAAQRYDQTGEMLGFNRIPCYIGAAREAPALFKYEGSYYLMTSGCTGWGANPAKYAICKGDSPLAEWTDMGNPCVTDSNVCKYGANLTFGTQSTSILPVNPQKGEYIYMGDRWNNNYPAGNELIDPKYVWLPIQFTTNGEMIIYPKNDWILDDLGIIQYAVTIETQMPSTVVRGGLDTLPETVAFTYAEETKTSKVSWKVESGNIYKAGSLVTVKGTLLDFMAGKTSFTTELLVLSDDLLYLVDCGITEESGRTSASFESAKELGTLKNDVADAVYQVENGWGLVADSIDGTKGYNADFGTMHESGYYGVNGSNSVGSKNVTYYVTLDAGNYDLTSGHCEWWNTSARTTEATVSYTKTDGTEYKETLYAINFGGTQYEKAQGYGRFEVEEDHTLVTITFGKSYASAVGGVVSHFAIARAFDEPEENEPVKPSTPDQPSQGNNDSSSSEQNQNTDSTKGQVNSVEQSDTVQIEENPAPKDEKVPEQAQSTQEIPGKTQQVTNRKDPITGENQQTELTTIESEETAKDAAINEEPTVKEETVLQEEKAELQESATKEEKVNEAQNEKMTLLSALQSNWYLFLILAVAVAGMAAAFAVHVRKKEDK